MRFLAIFTIIAVLFTDCSQPAQPAENASSPKKGTEQKKVEDPHPKHAADRTADSLISALTWLENNPNTSMWGILLKRSKWAKDVHHGFYTVLTPYNDFLKKEGVDLIAELKYPENQNLLDALMARHIIKTPLTITKTEGMKSLECIDGSTLNFQPGVQQIEGIYYELYQYGTFHGSVIPLNGVIDLPTKKLEKLVEKRKQAKSASRIN
jgi:uncharacterized surface protein with fasciclin (FAS1) repeats